MASAAFVKVLGKPCCLSYATLDQDGRPSQALRTLFLQETIRRGVLMPSLVVSYSHGDDDIDLTVEAIDGALAVYRRALDDGVERYLVGRPSQTVYRRLQPARSDCAERGPRREASGRGEVTAVPGGGSSACDQRSGCGPISRVLVLTMALTLGGWAIVGGLASSAAGEARSASTPVAAASNPDCAAAVDAAASRLCGH